MAKILIADDEPEVLAVYKTKLEQAGYTVVFATDGGQALSMAASEHPDMILLDIKMPVMNGVEVHQKMKEDPTLKNIKVVFLSAFGDPSHQDIDETLARESGALDFIKKGISLDEFIAKVKGYLPQS